MKNFSIIHLQATNIFSHSPFLQLNSPLSLRSSEFSNHFSTIIYSTSSLNLKNVKISNSLSTAIILSEELFQKKTYKKRQVLTEDSNRFESCLFYKISDSKYDGGALNLDSTDSTLKLIQCSFTLCSSTKNGGAVYVKCKKVTIENSCLQECSASKDGGAYYISKTTNFDLKDDLIQQSKGQTVVTFKVVNNIDFQHLNMTSNSGEDCAFFLSDILQESSTFQYNHFQSNSGDMVFSFSSGGEIEVRNSNFVSNAGEKALFSSDSKVFIIESYIQKDKSRYFVESEKEIILRDCFYQLTKEECENKIGKNGRLVRGDFSSNKTMTIKIITDDCPVNSSSSSALKVGTIIAIVLAGIILLVFLFLIMRKYCCFKFADSDPLIRKYTP